MQKIFGLLLSFSGVACFGLASKSSKNTTLLGVIFSFSAPFAWTFGDLATAHAHETYYSHAPTFGSSVYFFASNFFSNRHFCILFFFL
jgi:hypothetical protein